MNASIWAVAVAVVVLLVSGCTRHQQYRTATVLTENPTRDRICEIVQEQDDPRKCAQYAMTHRYYAASDGGEAGGMLRARRGILPLLIFFAINPRPVVVSHVFMRDHVVRRGIRRQTPTRISPRVLLMGKFFQIVGAQPSVHVHDFVEVVLRPRIEFFFRWLNVDWPPRPRFVFPINRRHDRAVYPRFDGVAEQRRVIECKMPRLRVVEQLLQLEIRYGVAVLV